MILRDGKAALAVLALLATAPLGAGAERSDWTVQEWTVDAGTTGMLVEDHRVPVVTVHIGFPAGTLSPWGRNHHLQEAFAIQMHDSAGALRKRADLLGIQIDVWAGPRWSTVWLTCRKEDLGPALALVKDVLANEDFDRHELGRMARSRKLGWTASLKEPQFVVGRTAAEILFQNGDPRARMFQKPDPVDTDRRGLAATRDAAIRFPGRIVGFAGDLSLHEARRTAQGLLPGTLPHLPADLRPHFPPLRPAGERPSERTVSLPNLTQVYFAYGRDSLSYQDTDWPASMIADHVLGGHFNSRLMLALRQEGGETYGAGVLNWGGLEPSIYGLGTFTRTDNAEQTERKLREVLATFHEHGITEEERARAASALVGRRAFDRQSPGQVLSSRLDERLSGLPDGFRDLLPERAAAVPLEEINAFIRRFYDPAAFTLLKVQAKQEGA